jgi:hypothetical protein
LADLTGEDLTGLEGFFAFDLAAMEMRFEVLNEAEKSARPGRKS